MPWIAEDYHRQVRMAEAVGDDAVPCARLSTGTHIYAAAFGCEVHRFPDSNPCAVPRVRTADEADKLEPPDIWKSPVLCRIFELARCVQRELGKDVFLGPPDMQSGFDTAALVWNKTDFLCAMLDENDSGAAKRLVANCARLFKTFLVEFRKAFPNCSPCHCPVVWAPPEMGPWLSNDECGAFRSSLFRDSCLPELVDLAETFGGLGMHCCAVKGSTASAIVIPPSRSSLTSSLSAASSTIVPSLPRGRNMATSVGLIPRSLNNSALWEERKTWRPLAC